MNVIEQAKGLGNEVEGKIKEVTGKVVGEAEREVEGKVQAIDGEAQAKLADVKQDMKVSSMKGT